MDKLDLEEKQKIAILHREKGDATDAMGWMYKGVKPEAEEYLLGKRLDKHIEGEEEKKDEASVIFGERIKANIALDMAAKMREDPLFAIRRKEEESRKKLLENPVKMKELQKLIEQQEKLKEKKKKSKKKNKKHKKSKNSDDSDDDDIMTKYLSILTSKHDKDKSGHKKKVNHQNNYSSDDESREEVLNPHRQENRSHATNRHSNTTQTRNTSRTHEDSGSNRYLFNRDSEVRHRHQHKDSWKDRNTSPPETYGDRQKKDRDITSDRRSSGRHDSRDSDSNRYDHRDRKRKNNNRMYHVKDIGTGENKKYKNNTDSNESDDFRSRSMEKESEGSNGKIRHKTVDNYRSKREYREERSGRAKNVKGRNPTTGKQRDTLSSGESDSSHSKSSGVGFIKDPEKTGNSHAQVKNKQRRRSSSSSSTSSEESEHRGKKVISVSHEPRQYGLIVSSSNQAISKPRQRSSSTSSSSSSPTKTSHKAAAVKTKQIRREPSPPRRKLTEEEKQRKLLEMSQNAVWREEQRESNVKRYRDEEQQREKNDKIWQKESGFLSSMMMNHASSSSVEDRLRRNKYNIQRTQLDLDKNFTKK